MKKIIILIFLFMVGDCAKSGAGHRNPSPECFAGEDGMAITGEPYRFMGATAQDTSENSAAGVLLVEWYIERAPSGSQIAIDPLVRGNVYNANSLTSAYFTPDVDGEYTVALTVYDNGVRRDGEPGPAKKGVDRVVVTASLAFGKENPGPKITGASSAQGATHSVVTLDGYEVSDTNFTLYRDYTETIGFGAVENFGGVAAQSWQLISKPGASELSAENIWNADTLALSFVPDAAGEFVFELSAWDNGLDNLGDWVGTQVARKTITVTAAEAKSGNPSPWVFVPATPDGIVGERYTVYGIQAGDNPAGGGGLAGADFAAWSIVSQPEGAALDQGDLTNATDSFQLSLTPPAAGEYIFEIIVTDNGLDLAGAAGDAKTVTARVVLSVALSENAAPQVDAGKETNWQIGVAYTHSGASATDEIAGGGAVASLLWTIVAAPANSTLTDADIVNSTTVNFGLTFDAPGVYLLRLTATDNGKNALGTTGDARAAYAEVGLRVFSAYNPPPVPSAGTAPSCSAGVACQSSSAATTPQSTDNATGGADINDGVAAWSFIAVPNGSALNDASITGGGTVAAPTYGFTPDVDGVYILELRVSDDGLNLDGTAGTVKTVRDRVSIAVDP